MRRSVLLLLLLALAGAGAALAQDGEAVRLPSPETIVGPPKGAPLTGEALELQTKETASLLRCPVCQGLSVYDSPATMAVNMKHQVRDLVAQGYTTEQVLAYFEASYGEFVRLNPKLDGMNWMVWALPMLLAIVGAWAVWRTVRGSKKPVTSETVEIEPVSIPSVDPELEPYLRRVRELAYGWPGGVPPARGE